MRGRLLLIVFGILAAGVLASPAWAQVDPPVIDPNDDPRHNCRCYNTTDEICNYDGYRIRLIDYVIDQNAGTSHWDYEICNETGMGTGCEPFLPLEHVEIALPLVGTCLEPGQDIQISQSGGFDNAQLECVTDDGDPLCGIVTNTGVDWFARCVIVGPSSLDAMECVTMRLSIAGEMPTLGPGAALTITKASSPDCARNCILGPACVRCDDPPPPPGDECLTRTAGFWGTHPHITGLYRPITVCGEPLSLLEAGSCESVTEALCVAPGRELRKNRAYAQLVRQLAAAKLNLNATAAFGGDCGEEIAARIAECETLCGAGQSVISNSGCIEDLANFNQSLDTFATTPGPFVSPGPANPEECQEANGNGLVIGKKGCM